MENMKMELDVYCVHIAQSLHEVLILEGSKQFLKKKSTGVSKIAAFYADFKPLEKLQMFTGKVANTHRKLDFSSFFS